MLQAWDAGPAPLASLCARPHAASLGPHSAALENALTRLSRSLTLLTGAPPPLFFTMGRGGSITGVSGADIRAAMGSLPRKLTFFGKGREWPRVRHPAPSVVSWRSIGRPAWPPATRRSPPTGKRVAWPNTPAAQVGILRAWVALSARQAPLFSTGFASSASPHSPPFHSHSRNPRRRRPGR